jgi:hypothetical protein
MSGDGGARVVAVVQVKTGSPQPWRVHVRSPVSSAKRRNGIRTCTRLKVDCAFAVRRKVDATRETPELLETPYSRTDSSNTPEPARLDPRMPI